MAVSEREVDQLGLSLARHVVRVDLCRLCVAVAHPLLQRPQRHLPGGGHLRRERVAQIVQPDRAHVGADERRLEVLQQPRVIEWTTRMRVRQDEVAVSVPHRRAVVLLELLDQARGERDRAHAFCPARAVGTSTEDPQLAVGRSGGFILRIGTRSAGGPIEVARWNAAIADARRCP
jgi:hypothetical protein